MSILLSFGLFVRFGLFVSFSFSFNARYLFVCFCLCFVLLGFFFYVGNNQVNHHSKLGEGHSREVYKALKNVP